MNLRIEPRAGCPPFLPSLPHGDAGAEVTTIMALSKLA